MDNRRESIQIATGIDGLNKFNEVKGDQHIDQVRVENVVTQSTLQDRDPQVQATNIMNAFNKGVDHAWYTLSNFRGERINPGEFQLGAFNKQPMLVAPAPENKRIARKWNLSPSDISEFGDKVKTTDPYYGMYGRHVLNVPVDKYVKAMSGNKPLLFGPGPHVIHDPNLQFSNGVNFDPAKDQIDILSPSIDHHTIHIIRVSAGQFAAVWIGADPVLLPARPDPYVFNTPLFKPGDKLFINQSDPWIHHGTINILRVPKGKIAKVWLNNEPRLLEYREEPYIFNTPYFKLQYASENEYFFDATSQLIVHGQIKRIIPKQTEVAITYNNGRLEIIRTKTAEAGAKDGNTAIVIDSPTHEFVDFLSTNMQTLNFPSEQTRRQRKKENANASSDEINHEIFLTRDSLEVGVKILVAYRIADPEKAVTQLGKDGIVPHIENLATVDMGKAIKQCSSQDFLTFWQNKPANANADQSVPQQMHFQDMVKEALARDLAEYGIELIRLNIETPKILNKEIAAKMEQQAVLLATTNAKEAALAQQTRITIAESEQKAEAARIAQEQVNSALKSNAEAKLKAAEMEAQALLVKAKAEQEAAALQGKQYRDYPELVRMKQVELQTAALSKAPIIMPPQMMPGMYGTGMPLFNSVNSQASAGSDVNSQNEDARRAVPGK